MSCSHHKHAAAVNEYLPVTSQRQFYVFIKSQCVISIITNFYCSSGSVCKNINKHALGLVSVLSVTWIQQKWGQWGMI